MTKLGEHFEGLVAATLSETAVADTRKNIYFVRTFFNDTIMILTEKTREPLYQGTWNTSGYYEITQTYNKIKQDWENTSIYSKKQDRNGNQYLKTWQFQIVLVKKLIDEDPKYSPETTQIATIDRTIFIVGTYIIRTLVLLMIDWGINSHMITTFKQSFEAYISGYIALFLVWVAIANISENEYQENIVLSSLFYYINTRANKLTTFRILLHIFVQISLIPILFIVKYKSSEIDQDSFEQRQGLYNAISQFSFFIWLMTSIIASRF